MESRMKVHCECGKTGLVDRKHIGKSITCPKCGIARIKVEDPEACLKTNDFGGTPCVDSKLAADSKVKTSPIPPTHSTELTRNPLWTGRNILIGVLTLAILAVVLVTAINLLPRSSDSQNPLIADVAVTHTDKRDDDLLPEIAEQVEPKEVVKAEDVAEKQPAVILPPTPAEIAKIEYERLRALVHEIGRDHNLVSAPINEESQILKAEIDELTYLTELSPKSLLRS